MKKRQIKEEIEKVATFFEDEDGNYRPDHNPPHLIDVDEDDEPLPPDFHPL